MKQIYQINHTDANEIARLVNDEKQTMSYSTRRVLGVPEGWTIKMMDGGVSAGDRIEMASPAPVIGRKRETPVPDVRNATFCMMNCFEHAVAEVDRGEAEQVALLASTNSFPETHAVKFEWLNPMTLFVSYDYVDVMGKGLDIRKAA